MWLSLHAKVGPGLLTLTELLDTDAEMYFRALSDQRSFREGVEQARKEMAGAGVIGQMLERRTGRPEA